MAALGQELAALVYDDAADDTALRQSPLYPALREILRPRAEEVGGFED